MVKLFRTLCLALAFLAGFSAISATTQVITNNGLTLTYDDAACGGASASVCNTAMQTAFNKVSDNFQLGNLPNYLKSMSSAQSISTKGQGVDYTTNPSLFVVGGTMAAGVDIGDSTFKEAWNSLSKSGGLSASGYAVQFSLMAGIHLGAFKFASPILGVVDLNRLTIYAHAASYDFSSLLKQDGLSVKSSQFGFHTKYKLIEPKSIGLGSLNWGGLDFVTGLTVASNTAGYQKTFDQISSGDGSLSNPLIRVTPSGTINVKNNAVTVPFEIATSVRMLYFLSLFGGAGVDLNFGKSSLDVALTAGSTSFTVQAAGAPVNAGNITASASESANGRFGDLRFFTGLAFNLVPLKNTNVISIIVQGNISTGGSVGANVGVRAGW